MDDRQEGGQLVIVGAVPGAFVAWIAAQMTRSLLLDNPATDPWPVAAGLLIVSVTALLATVVPAARV